MKKYIYKFRVPFCGALLCTLLSSFFAVILQFFKGDILDYAAAGQLGDTIKYAVLLLAFILFEILFHYFYRRFLSRFVVGCTRTLKRDIFQSILKKSYVRYKEIPQGTYIAKFTTEADAIKVRYFDMCLSFCEILFKIVFVSIALFWLDWRIAIVTLALLTTPLYIPKLIEKRLQMAQSAYMAANAEMIGKVTDWLSGFEILKNYSVEHQIMGVFSRSNDRTMEKMLRDNQLSAASQLLTTLISYLSYFVVLGCAAWLVLTERFSAGDFFVAIGMIDQLSWPLISLAEIIHHLIAVRPTCKAMEDFLSSSEDNHNKTLSAFDKEISFDHVTFGYEGGAAVLNNRNLRIEKGKRYLFCGPSGCGKTTAVNLILRYYDPQSGVIRVDGESVLKYAATYGCVTVLRQDAVLFHDTLRNNLTMYQDIEDCKLKMLISQLGLHKFANQQALDSIVAENGTNLSGGERRRICLARALLRNTELLILDEPLANLDGETARRIEDLILSIRDKTLIVVSHQFSADKTDRFDEVIDFGK